MEEEFTNAIRGKEEITMVPFETGVHYMEWTEAVIRSAQTGQAIYLPVVNTCVVTSVKGRMLQ